MHNIKEVISESFCVSKTISELQFNSYLSVIEAHRCRLCPLLLDAELSVSAVVSHRNRFLTDETLLWVPLENKTEAEF